MGQVRHGSATTTHAVRAALQRLQASIAELSRELGINPKTVAKWRNRETVEDRNAGPKEPRSTVLSEVKEARSQITAWKDDYNRNRPHSSLGNLTPYEFALKMTLQTQAA
ncbi:integrase core domain-containing protein [Stappia stellulata]|uniref:integrase core domain-containing protein n=1 Tax=Stappia stellulata TaxID=71235 RepID=UPI001CD46AF5|nr:integrase core domain-containing protein [Stappia stellulata]MCA1244065.1 integrase core domain-containing protein [Stappia stellulata]